MPAWAPVRSDRPTGRDPPTLFGGLELVNATALHSEGTSVELATRPSRPRVRQRRERTLARGCRVPDRASGSLCGSCPANRSWNESELGRESSADHRAKVASIHLTKSSQREPTVVHHLHQEPWVTACLKGGPDFGLSLWYTKGDWWTDLGG